MRWWCDTVYGGGALYLGCTSCLSVCMLHSAGGRAVACLGLVNVEYGVDYGVVCYCVGWEVVGCVGCLHALPFY